MTGPSELTAADNNNRREVKTFNRRSTSAYTVAERAKALSTTGRTPMKTFVKKLLGVGIAAGLVAGFTTVTGKAALAWAAARRSATLLLTGSAI